MAQSDRHTCAHDCDTSTRNVLRDRAILLLLSRLGLRAGEVARLGLDDSTGGPG